MSDVREKKRSEARWQIKANEEVLRRNPDHPTARQDIQLAKQVLRETGGGEGRQ